MTQAVKPPVAESAVWTGEPEYDRSLFVRVYCPDGLQQTQLRCTLTCNDQIFKTGILDPADDEEVEIPCIIESIFKRMFLSLFLCKMHKVSHFKSSIFEDFDFLHVFARIKHNTRVQL